MIKLIKLELQRIHLRSYFTGAVISGVILLVFLYFAAYAAKVEQDVQFMSYDNIFRLINTLSILLFAIFSATMYSRIIIKEYSGKRLALLFSYPVSRKKIFLAKVLTVFSFVMVSMFLCCVIPITIFSITEHYSPIVSDTITMETFQNAILSVIFSILGVGTVGLLSLYIGFIKKSVPALFISTFIFSSIYGNIAVSAAGTIEFTLLSASISIIVVIAVLLLLSSKINRMEVL